MPRLATLLLLCATLPSACSGSSASASSGKQPAPGDIAANFALEQKPYCDSCVRRVTKAVDWLPGVSVVEVTVGDPNIRVWHDAFKVSDTKILEVLNKAGEKASLAP